MKNSALLIFLLFLVLFKPSFTYADDHRWFSKIKDFFTSNIPINPKYCVSYDGSLYVVGEIFKSKSCKKGDKEVFLGASSPATSSAEVGSQGPKGDKGDQGLQGIQGIQGDKGDKGDSGPVGLSGLSGWEKVSTSSASTTDQLKTVTVNCPENKKVLSGGFVVISSTVTFYTVSNFPSAENAWTTSIHRSSTATPWDLTTYAICASIP